jgi:hypothetical protein
VDEARQVTENTRLYARTRKNIRGVWLKAEIPSCPLATTIKAAREVLWRPG